MFSKGDAAPATSGDDSMFPNKKHATSFDYQSSIKSQVKYLRLADNKESPFPQILIVDD